MSHVTFQGTHIKLAGKFPEVGDKINNFTLTDNNLKTVSEKDFKQKILILNIFPSLDTGVCAMSVRKFNEAAAGLRDCEVLCISKDLPFAQGRFCTTENINKVKVLSAFRHPEFGRQFGVEIIDGPAEGLLARAVVVLNDKREVVYTELVPEIVQEPNYDQCLSIVANLT